jgi:hypothetical protein
MLSYRIYFRGSGVIVGRDDFKAADDAAALLIACTLRDACSDVCRALERHSPGGLAAELCRHECPAEQC